MDKSWKAWERRVAKLFGCKRRGADFRGENGGKDDLTHDYWAVECKLLSRPTFGQMLEAAKQAEAAGAVVEVEEGFSRHPIAIVKRKFDEDADALVIQRLGTFKAWHL